LKSVVVNLLLNSFDAIKDGSGEVHIHTQKQCIKNKEYARLSVRDNGEGITREHRDSVFELMYTTKQEGSGFGLFFVKKVIEKYGGTIEIQSEPGRGTTFTVYLPLQS
ncbi:MAG: HAMP domain-containing sensor histidine kinase, partial [Spirochaetia bacterium]